jgi:hypothetical protein
MTWFQLARISRRNPQSIAYQMVYPLLSENYNYNKYNLFFQFLEFFGISTASVTRSEIDAAVSILDDIRPLLLQELNTNPEISQDKLCALFLLFFINSVSERTRKKQNIDRNAILPITYELIKSFFSAGKVRELLAYIFVFDLTGIDTIDMKALEEAVKKQKKNIIFALFSPAAGMYFDPARKNDNLRQAALAHTAALLAIDQPEITKSLNKISRTPSPQRARMNRSGILPSVPVKFNKEIKAKDFTWVLVAEKKAPVHHATYRASNGVVATIIPVPHKDLWYVISEFALPALKGFAKFTAYMESLCLADLSAKPAQT